MTGENDNRMLWIRNIEKLELQKKENFTKYECEIATECHIAGILDYNNGKIACSALTIDKDQNGLFHYLLIIKFANFEEPYSNNNASKNGYALEGGIIRELLSLFSLYFQCRFYLIASSLCLCQNKLGLKTKREHLFIYKKCDPLIHPTIFSSRKRNFADGLESFLNSVKSLDEKYHQQFVLACSHYAKSLKEVGLDDEMIFIRLVSAIEAMLKFISLTSEEDVFRGKKLGDLIKKNVLLENEKEELNKIFKNRKIKARFIKFVNEYSGNYLKEKYDPKKPFNIAKEDLPATLATIYDARSDYLHNGQSMHLSRHTNNGEKWDREKPIKCSLNSSGTIIDKRVLPDSQLLPYPFFFEGLVRQCLLNFLKQKTTI